MKHKHYFEAHTLYSNSIKITIAILFLFPTTYFAQNKKEQIKSLTSNNDSLSLLLTYERGVYEKEKEKLNIENQGLIIENKKLLNDNAGLIKETQGLKIENKKLLEDNAGLNLEKKIFKQENLKISKDFKRFKDSILVSQEFKQILLFKEEHITEIYEIPSFSHEFALIQITPKEIKGYIGKANYNGHDKYFISGKLLNDKYIGDAFLIGCETADCKTPVGKFEIKINKQTIELTSDFNFNFFNTPIYNGLQNFEGDINLKGEPNKNSKPLLSLISETEKTDAEIKEIGPFENGNLWYKVKINNVEGWLFGGLCDICFF